MTGCLFFFSSRRRHTRLQGDWSSDVCSSDLDPFLAAAPASRLPFVIRTPDRRFPAGNDRPAQQAVVVPGNFTTVPYFQNRATASDRPGDPLQISQYDTSALSPFLSRPGSVRIR